MFTTLFGFLKTAYAVVKGGLNISNLIGKAVPFLIGAVILGFLYYYYHVRVIDNINDENEKVVLKLNKELKDYNQTIRLHESTIQQLGIYINGLIATEKDLRTKINTLDYNLSVITNKIKADDEYDTPPPRKVNDEDFDISLYYR